ncbi:MAG: peptide ABC transporter substrate-binding protein [Candidatus Lambdaproteobacteria bacterium]|nr:peptide ABC transporter substrate-binding protein [Candidatus Lambdaproteobacteria bacterium]
MTTIRTATVTGALAALLALAPQPTHAQKYGGWLNIASRGNPSSMSIHESSSTTEQAPIAPLYNNVVQFDPFVAKEGPNTIIGDLAERWEWRNGGKELVLTLRKGVRWHDGRPFTAADVKYTFDAVRGASQERLKLNPRKGWYFNVGSIGTNGDHEVTFTLKRPQPSLLSMLASGQSPVHPAHVRFSQLRTEAVGTGPFKLKQYVRDQKLVVEKNKDYFEQGRPYLDGINFYIILKTSTWQSALVAKQVDTYTPSMHYRPIYDALRQADPSIQFIEKVTNTTINIIVNTKKPPFDNPQLRRAVNLAMDRNAIIKSVYAGGAVTGSAFIPEPYGAWGLNPEQLAELPGYGNPEQNKAEARRILKEQGYGAGNPFRLKVSTRNIPAYVDPAVWAVAELKAVGIEPELEQIETGMWYPKVARRDFVLGLNATAISIDDPDAVLYENYKCGSQRNYTDYCNADLEQKFDAQSMEADVATRRKLVEAIDMKLQDDGARPYLVYRTEYYPHQPYVKNLIPHQSVYNWLRMTHVWLDK